jgi:hypothetical protein
LQQRLMLWRQRPPSLADFPLRFPPFNQVNYEFILFGSGWGPAGTPESGVRIERPPSTRRLIDHLLQRLPTHSSLLSTIHRCRTP